MNITFSVNQHDTDGDVWDKCILLHIDKTTILKLKHITELKDVIRQLKKVEKEIIENYGHTLK